MSNFFLVLGLLLAFLYATSSPGDKTSGYLVHIPSEESVSVLELNAKRFGIRFVEQISPHVYIFKEDEHSAITTNFQEFFKEFQEKILEVQPIRTRTMKRPRLNAVSKPSELKHFGSARECPPYFGMDIEKAWALNYTGEGVNVAVLDVGIDTHHPYLKQNIRGRLGFNFVDTNRAHEFAPEYEFFEADDLMDHGNNIAGLIVAVKGNGLCCRGVAYNASVVPLVVFKLEYGMPGFDDKHISKALVHKNQQIQIYSNSFNYQQPFVEPSIAVKDALLTGVNKGRAGKGSVFVFTLGDTADYITDGNTDFYANNIYSITVGSVGEKGTVPKYAIPCSCIIASTLGEGKTLFHNYFETTSHRHSCTDTFKGNSASAGIMAAVVALGLNNRLIPKPICHLPKIQYVNVNVKDNSGAIFIEHVMADIQFTATNESYVTIKLFSPAGTCSVLLHNSSGVRNQEPVSRKWNFTSVQFWGELPYGNWTLLMTQFDRATNKSYTNFSVKDVVLHIYGIRRGEKLRHKFKTYQHEHHTKNGREEAEEAKLLDLLRDPEKRNSCFTVEREGGATHGKWGELTRQEPVSIFISILFVFVSPCVFFLICVILSYNWPILRQ